MRDLSATRLVMRNMVVVNDSIVRIAIDSQRARRSRDRLVRRRRLSIFLRAV